MDAPTCRCGKRMTFLFDNKVTELWACPPPSCGRVLVKQKRATTGVFYRIERRRSGEKAFDPG
ncbi:hypothetical protein ES707_05588 [subsurface metagenome]